MDDTSKYLIHATVTADGVVERSDVVGAIFGQTEGLLGDELDLRELQQSSKVGRIDVEIDSEAGRSHGSVTIATSLDKVATATLAAALESLTRVGPCKATLEVEDIEDVRAAKRRRVVERAKELLATAFDDSMMSSEEILREVREHARVADISEYDGLPAGPRVGESDAIVVVEGRADVLQLLKYGIKNAIAVEGTDVPDAVATLTQDRTVTAFLDGDRGGDLILKELSQVGEVDYVAFAPEGKSVEDLLHHEVFEALREKVPFSVVAETSAPHEAVGTREAVSMSTTESDGGATDSCEPSTAGSAGVATEVVEAPPEAVETAADGVTAETAAPQSTPAESTDPETTAEESTATEPADEQAPVDTLRGHVEAVVAAGTGQVRLLDEEFAAIVEGPASEAFDRVREAETVPHAVVLDGELSQRVLDVSAQRGVDHVVAASLGEFVKRPTGTRIRTAERLLGGS
ncbi:DNA primase DnaG [Haloarchaeobius iranensis]|uniref:DNA primase DnaG n=1 Tax=Haloarchaeobius iranensis TaxID=996166 RepID=A0A1G9X2K9_9EURY|nr:DNA primase DnaG [Haloarchaeobius iranensis]SDM90979.1 DNA primase [Haloarchaeobius iranensis]